MANTNWNGLMKENESLAESQMFNQIQAQITQKDFVN